MVNGELKLYRLVSKTNERKELQAYLLINFIQLKIRCQMMLVLNGKYYITFSKGLIIIAANHFTNPVRVFPVSGRDA